MTTKKKKKKNPHHGPSFQSWLEELPDKDQVAIQAGALKLQLAIRARKEMEKKGIGVNQLVKLMGTSPSQVQRLLDGSYTGVSLKNLVKLYAALGKELKLTIK